MIRGVGRTGVGRTHNIFYFFIQLTGFKQNKVWQDDWCINLALYLQNNDKETRIEETRIKISIFMVSDVHNKCL